MSPSVEELITALAEGTMNLDEVAQAFRKRRWPRRKSPAPATYTELAEAAEQDPEVYLPGSFDDVAAAHQDGKISDYQYEVLSAAVSESKRMEDRAAEGGSH